jgi:hypothetical protein|mmetsp:Transcript_94633/g.158876  ORF Transcript_94633/g.158876 Transcript_94633/m.158876 type:complete len:111 (-) Transcript_94633:996-1328(-)
MPRGAAVLHAVEYVAGQDAALPESSIAHFVVCTGHTNGRQGTRFHSPPYRPEHGTSSDEWHTACNWFGMGCMAKLGPMRPLSGQNQSLFFLSLYVSKKLKYSLMKRKYSS